MLTIDGSAGEGGGQILRTCLTLSMLTGEPFRIKNIRAGRAKPGLLRQHLTCVRAAAEISGAKVQGGELGSTRLTFTPGEIRAGSYRFPIGSAGSTTLVLQTVLPALARATAPSRVAITGGTHNKAAPPFEFLERAYLPLLRQIGFNVEAGLLRPGYFPAGGGEIAVEIAPATVLRPLVLEDAGALISRKLDTVVSALNFDIAERERDTAGRLLGWPADCLRAREETLADGHGNVLVAELEYANLTEVFTAFGERDLSAETVAKRLADEVHDYLAAGAPVGPHLADQLLLPMALAGGGCIVTMAPTPHTRTNCEIIEKFLPVEIAMHDLGDRSWRIAVGK